MSRFPPPCDEAYFLADRDSITEQHEVMPEKEWEWNRRWTKEPYRDTCIPVRFESIPKEEQAGLRRDCMENVGRFMSDWLMRGN